MKNRISLLREFSIPLIVGVVIALAWANMDYEGCGSGREGELQAG